MPDDLLARLDAASIERHAITLDAEGALAAIDILARWRGLIAAVSSALRAGGDRAAHAHPDDEAVDRFGAAMKEKLAKKRAEGRSGWEDLRQCSASLLSTALRNHVDKGDPVDVGNFAMMLHQRGERIMKAASASRKALPAASGERPSASSGDAVNHPPHYTAHPSGVECIAVVEHMGFCLGNAVKYIWRADLKGNALEDLRKARFYIDREIARRERLALPAAGEPT